MKKRIILSLALAVSLSACASSNYTTPVQVTRFAAENSSELGSGAIAVVAAPGVDENSLAFEPYREAVAAQLYRLGYTIVAEGDATQKAEVHVDSIVDRAGHTRSPVSVGVGGSTGSYRSGVGVGIGLDLSGPPPEVRDTQLSVWIKSSASEERLWEGRASFATRADGELAQPRAIAAKLADALFAGFPGESGETISVK